MPPLHFDATKVPPGPPPEMRPEDLARQMLADEVARVRSAGRGERNNVLNTAAYTAGRLCGSGALEVGYAEVALSDAAAAVAMGRFEARATIKSGLKGGMAKPWEWHGSRGTAPVAPTPPANANAVQEAEAELAAKIETAQKTYDAAGPIDGSRGVEYLARRGIQDAPPSLRWSGKFNGLVVPLHQPDGGLTAIQKIPVHPDLSRGTKETNGRMLNALFVVPGDDAVKVVADGPEDALSIRQETGWTTFATCGKQRFHYVAEHIHAGDKVILVRDRDDADGTGYDKAVAAILAKMAAVVIWDPPEPHKDANDLATAQPGTLGDALREAAAAFVAPVLAEPVAPTPDEFPKELLRPGGTLGALADWITATARYPQPELALASALVTLGALMGRRVKGPTGLRTNLYAIGLAESGNGKGHGRACMKSIMAAIGQIGIMGGDRIASGAGLVSRLRASPNTLYALDEFGMMLAKVYAARADATQAEIMHLMTQMFSEAGQTWMGADYADRKTNTPEPIVQPHLSLMGISNPTTLFNALGSGALKDGSIARFLVFASSEQVPYPNHDAGDVGEPPIDLLGRLTAIITDVPVPEGRGNLSGMGLANPVPYAVPMSPGAKAKIRAFEDAMVEQRRSVVGSDQSSILARVVEHALKIACIVAVADTPADPVIRDGHIEYGIALADFCAKWLCRQAEGRIADTDFGRKLIGVLAAIKAAGPRGITKTELTSATQRKLNGSRERTEIIGELFTSGSIAVNTIKTGGRPTEIYYAAEFAPPGCVTGD